MADLNHNSPKILIVEDDLYMQTILNHCLNEEFSVVVFDNGIDGLAFLQEGYLPDMIILDLNIPLLNGMEFITQVRSSGFFSTIPIIVLSGTENTETKIKCLEAGADDFIVKPFNPRELEARVKIILKRAGRVIIS